MEMVGHYFVSPLHLALVLLRWWYLSLFQFVPRKRKRKNVEDAPMHECWHLYVNASIGCSPGTSILKGIDSGNITNGL